MRIIFALTAILFAVGCSKEDPNAQLKIFRYNEHASVSSLDPAFSRTQSNNWIVNQLFNGLVQLDDSLKIQPDIAKKWTISNQGLRYTFILRDDVFFHKSIAFKTADSTRRVTANDFVYSFKRIEDEQTASPGKWIFQNVKSYYATGNDTLTIELKTPSASFLGLLTMKYASVVPFEAVHFFGKDFRKNPIGTGAFRFQMWKENDKLVLRKNPLYFEKDTLGVSLPYLDAVSISFLPEKQSEFLLFLQGKLDLLNAIDASYKDEIITTDGQLQPKYKDQFRMIKSDFLNTEYLGIVMDKNIPEMLDLNIRKAIACSFDKEKMMLYLRNQIGTPALGGFIPKGLAGHSSFFGYSYQPEKAALWVKQFRAKTGIQPKITITTDASYVDLCEYIQQEVEKIGILCRIEIMPPSALRQGRASGKLSIFRSSWIADYPDAENYLALFYSKNFAPKGSNYTHFYDKHFDKLYEQSIQEDNLQKRIEYYKEMDRILMEKLPVIPLYYDQSVRFVSKHIKGLKTNPINLLQLKYVDKTNG